MPKSQPRLPLTERALALAASGKFKAMGELRSTLSKEGYQSNEIQATFAGLSLRRSVALLMAESTGARVKGMGPQIPQAADYAVLVKARNRPAGSWTWEIRRTGRRSPVKSSAVIHRSMAAAQKEGEEALARYLNKHLTLRGRRPVT